VSQYSELLDKLKKEISVIRKKKSKFNKHQKIMIDFINGVTDSAIFNINGITIELGKGDDKKGFKHIILKHYHSNDLEAMDILNIIDTYVRGLKLHTIGVGNPYLSAYAITKNQKEFRLIIDENEKPHFVITSYRKT
jgi:hypothetical protein